jgi:2-oxoglutarate ferredoxin oxidoreductase subunit alpha
VSWLRPITLWPFPIAPIVEGCRGLDILLVPEMNLGQYSREIERFVDCEVRCLSKIGGVLHSVREILSEIGRAGS